MAMTQEKYGGCASKEDEDDEDGEADGENPDDFLAFEDGGAAHGREGEADGVWPDAQE